MRKKVAEIATKLAVAEEEEGNALRKLLVAKEELVGITSTNDDPRSCAICADAFPPGALSVSSSWLSFCCGKQICLPCRDSNFKVLSSGNGAYGCCLCKRSISGSNIVGMMKKNAKNGHPWAQFWLAMSYYATNPTGTLTQSYFEAVRWFRKAAGKRHPEANLYLGICCLRGRGCAQNLLTARVHLEKAALLDPHLTGESHQLLFEIGQQYMEQYMAQRDYATLRRAATAEEEKAAEQAISIYLPLAEAGMLVAQYKLGFLLYSYGDHSTAGTAKRWYVAAALQGNFDGATSALACCDEDGQLAQTRYWFSTSIKLKEEMDIVCCESQLFLLDRASTFFRNLRDNCGGCGASLGGTMRKICRQCKTYCYCGRECQKLHWNRLDGKGHRDDCMAVASLKEKMKNSRADNIMSSGNK